MERGGFQLTATGNIGALRDTAAAKAAAGPAAAAAGPGRAGVVAAVTGDGRAVRSGACVGAIPRGWGAIVAVGAAAHAHDLGVDGCADAVIHLAVYLGQCVACAQIHSMSRDLLKIPQPGLSTSIKVTYGRSEFYLIRQDSQVGQPLMLHPKGPVA